jgi:hypothetical protein
MLKAVKKSQNLKYKLITIRKKTLLYSALTFGVIVAVILLFLFNPAECSFFPPCPFHKLTGFYCPGCGSLRAVNSLLHGNIKGAFALNSLMVISTPFIMLLLIKPSIGYKRATPYIVLTIFSIYWIARNIPVEPFSMLAPH